MSEGAASDLLPSPGALEAASRLERHVVWSTGFWLAYVFTISPPQARFVREHVASVLEGIGRGLRVLRPGSPGDFEKVLGELLRERVDDCLWIEAVKDGRAVGASWSDAWVRFVLRANERRELLRDYLSGGLVLVSPPELKPGLRRAGPDLWSVRNFVFELWPGSIHDETKRHLGAMHDAIDAIEHGVDSFTDSALLAEDLRRLPDALDGRPPHVQAMIKVRLAMRLADDGRADEATKLLHEAIGVYRAIVEKHPEGYASKLTEVLHCLGLISSQLGRFDEALVAMREVVDRYRASAERVEGISLSLVSALADLGAIERSAGRHEDAVKTLEEAVGDYRGFAALQPDLYGVGVARALHDFGSSLLMTGRSAEALTVTQEALELHRDRAARGQDDVAVEQADVLMSLGSILIAHGRYDEAAEATREAADIHRRLAEARPDEPTPLAGALRVHGTSCMTAGRFAEAQEAFADGLRILLSRSEDRPRLLTPMLRGLVDASKDGRLEIPDDLRPALDSMPLEDSSD